MLRCDLQLAVAIDIELGNDLGDILVREGGAAIRSLQDGAELIDR